MYKRIYDSDEIVVDYYNDGKPMIRISVFEDGHWKDEHFVELPTGVGRKRKVVRAHWIPETFGERHYIRCSACGKRYPTSPNHNLGINMCPACGATTEEEENE